MRLQEDKAKLCHEIDLLKEKNAGWKKLHENTSSSMKMLQALIKEQKEELAKLRIEHPAAVKVRNVVVEQMMKARIEKSRVMDTMKKMAEETRKEMEVAEANMPCRRSWSRYPSMACPMSSISKRSSSKA